MRNIKVWDIVKVNGAGDLYMMTNLRPFIEKECIVRQITKSGLYICELPDGQQERFAKRNLDLVKVYDPKESPFPIWNKDVA